MKTATSHIPPHKQKELTRIVELINKHFDPNMVILYGSYARGDYVDIEREYQSDFDILLVCGQKQKKNVNKINALEKDIRLDESIQTMVHLQYECISTINNEIRKYNYLFVDIACEGVLLYDNQEVELAEVKELEPKERHEKAIRDHNYWFKSSYEFQEMYAFAVTKSLFNKAAFNLHQRVEHLFMDLLLVFTGYKPKTHSLTDLIAMGEEIDQNIRQIFPSETKEEKHLYELLEKAYVDARYDMNYSITEKELKTLEAWGTDFEKLITELCDKELSILKEKAKK